uniref:Chemokine interleukin-8-like domain-containing protein n=1 Tax=Oryzias latipes TaxID=8090 RepID=A0A3B3H537_ORYLA
LKNLLPQYDSRKGSLKFTRSFSQAMQHDFEESTLCCFKFSKIPIPFVLVVNVKKTSASCPIQGVETRKRKICVSKTSIWGHNFFNRVYNLENIGDEDLQH